MAQLEDLRNKTGELLDEGLKAGFLTPEEHSWRKGHLRVAATAGDLDVLVGDLLDPARSGPSAVAAGPKTSLDCVLSSRTLTLSDLGSRTQLSTVLGSTRLDLRGLTPGRELALEVAVVLGEAVIEVPEGVGVRVSVTPVLAECQVDPTLGDGEPQLRITGDVVLGTLRVVQSKKEIR